MRTKIAQRSRSGAGASPPRRGGGPAGDPAVLIVGAGPAGLAAAAELGRAGVPAVILERADAVGASWRGRYDRLRLNTSRWTSRLPGSRFPKGTAMFPPRDDVVRYLEAYARRRAFEIELGTSVQRIEQADG